MTNPRGPTRALAALGALAVLATLGWLFPPFHIVALKDVRAQQTAAAFDAAKVAALFWDASLLPAATRAVDATALLAALETDSVSARKRHGRTTGLGGATLFLVKGVGHVTAVEEDAVVVALNDGNAKVSLATGPVFGNTLRDVTGLLDESTYPNSQDFNDLSAQLNSIVEAKVTPALRAKAAMGGEIRFVGCTELGEGATPAALSVIPLTVEWP